MNLLKRFLGTNQTSPNSEFETSIGYKFSRPELLKQAFTHRSMTAEPRENYERLEFLGDAVIDIVISRKLMKLFPEGDEGLLTQKRSALVQKSFLGMIGNKLDLLSHLDIEPTVDLKSEKIVERQAANMYEALIGAVFLDGGLDPARKLVLDTIWKERVKAWESVNYKGQLIELCHVLNLGNPKFQVTDVSGPDHQKLFEVHVKIKNELYPSGIGSNKKTAEQSAAQNALETLSS